MLVPLASAAGIFKGGGAGVTNAVYHAGSTVFQAGSTMMTNQLWPPRALPKGWRLRCHSPCTGQAPGQSRASEL